MSGGNNHDYDLFVLGAGSGGLATAKRAASYGARVAIAEDDRVGGTCVIRGCIPKKLMVYASEHGDAIEDAAGYGWPVERGRVDWESLVRRRDEAVLSLERLHEKHLVDAGVELLRGRAHLTAPNRIEIDGRTVSARTVLVATGSTPILPSIEGIEHAITSDGFFELRKQPRRIAIVGGGYIAVEFASILRGLGSEVVLVIRRDLPLRGFDIDLRRELHAALESQGVDVRAETTVGAIVRSDDSTVLEVSGPGGDGRIESDDALVYAVGRTPNSRGLGLEELGVEIAPGGEIVVDEDGSTAVAGVFAVGDVVGRSPLTPVAIQAGRAMADRVFGGKQTRMSYDGIPTAVFTEPPIGTVGLTEEDAVQRYGADGVDVYKARFNPLIHMLTERKVPVLVKLVVERGSERVLGCHMIGHDAPEIIQGLAVAMKAGATKADFDATIGIHPSTGEEFVTLR
ncbi:MAG: glutathione-disulfide reductase [Candidatus Binatia bacterium]